MIGTRTRRRDVSSHGLDARSSGPAALPLHCVTVGRDAGAGGARSAGLFARRPEFSCSSPAVSQHGSPIRHSGHDGRCRGSVTPRAHDWTTDSRRRHGQLRTAARRPMPDASSSNSQRLHAVEIAARAAEHDRDGTFPIEAIDAMKASGFTPRAVPQEFGGLGVTSLHDLMVGINRLGRADGSIAIAINMHFAVAAIAGRMLRAARSAVTTPRLPASEDSSPRSDPAAIAMANATESGTDVRYPITEVTRVEGGWRLDGHKIFGTLSPVADVMIVTCRHRRDDGEYSGRHHDRVQGNTRANDPRQLGCTRHPHASGSNDVLYEKCVIPDELFFEENDWGELAEGLLIIGTTGNLGLLGAFTGIAEAAA